MQARVDENTDGVRELCSDEDKCGTRFNKYVRNVFTHLRVGRMVHTVTHRLSARRRVSLFNGRHSNLTGLFIYLLKLSD